MAGTAGWHRDRKQHVTATSIAKDLLDRGLEDEALFTAMWEWHDKTGIETRDMFAQYQKLQKVLGEPPN